MEQFSTWSGNKASGLIDIGFAIQDAGYVIGDKILEIQQWLNTVKRRRILLLFLIALPDNQFHLLYYKNKN